MRQGNVNSGHLKLTALPAMQADVEQAPRPKERMVKLMGGGNMDTFGHGYAVAKTAWGISKESI